MRPFHKRWVLGFLKQIIPKPIFRLKAKCTTWFRLRSTKAASHAIGPVDEWWRRRIDDIIAAPESKLLPRVSGAGELDGYCLTMHNGVQVSANSYYGDGTLNMLLETEGVHEPQEEFVFEQVIRLLPEECTMLELGAYWAYYSLSLLAQRPQARCYLVEPDYLNILSGRLNFRLNRRKGRFLQAAVGRQDAKRPRVVCVDSLCERHSLSHLHILHSDIQGAELDMLQGADGMLTAHAIDYVFISTHSNPLHEDCTRFLEAHDYTIVAEADLNDTYSYDGLIVAKRSGLEKPGRITISRKSTHSQ